SRSRPWPRSWSACSCVASTCRCEKENDAPRRGRGVSAEYPVVILGAGLTGLSAAYHLGVPSLVIEREAEVGGLARTHDEDGFTFDCTGHLLHLRDPRVIALVEALLPRTFARHERRALIYSKGVFTPYPFQAN